VFEDPKKGLHTFRVTVRHATFPPCFGAVLRHRRAHWASPYWAVYEMPTVSEDVRVCQLGCLHAINLTLCVWHVIIVLASGMQVDGGEKLDLAADSADDFHHWRDLLDCATRTLHHCLFSLSSLTYTPPCPRHAFPRLASPYPPFATFGVSLPVDWSLVIMLRMLLSPLTPIPFQIPELPIHPDAPLPGMGEKRPRGISKGPPSKL
jgi:hypothetical protein